MNLVPAFPNARAMGEAAAAHAAASIRRLAALHGAISVVFATGASQLETLRALTAIPDLPWHAITGFHLDEYLGLPPDHPASFRHYLRQNLISRVPFRAFHEIDGNCDQYAAWLRADAPQLCLLGIGENGHLAFNDPAEADFADPEDVRIVALDRECRLQQVHEGWFPSLANVPLQAITLTIPAILRIPELILSVPGKRKASIVARTLQEEISSRCPATILRRHPHAYLYLDRESAYEIKGG